MNIEQRLRRLEEALLAEDERLEGVNFTPSDERPPPPSRDNRQAYLAWLEAVAMDDSIPDAPE